MALAAAWKAVSQLLFEFHLEAKLENLQWAQFGLETPSRLDLKLFAMTLRAQALLYHSAICSQFVGIGMGGVQLICSESQETVVTKLP